MKSEFENQQPLVQSEYNTVLICYNEEQVEREVLEGITKTYYLYDTIRVCKLAVSDYGSLVSGIIRYKYSADKVEAIILNHGDGNPEHESEYDNLQAWRVEAKTLAKEILGMN